TMLPRRSGMVDRRAPRPRRRGRACCSRRDEHRRRCRCSTRWRVAASARPIGGRCTRTSRVPPGRTRPVERWTGCSCGRGGTCPPGPEAVCFLRMATGRLFVGFARTHPGSPFAPKALVAALAVLPDAHASLVAALDARYPASPYTLALRGADSPAFAAAEDFLAQSLGVEREALQEASFVRRVAPPVPG